MKMLTLFSMFAALLGAAPVLFAQEAPRSAVQPDQQKAREQAIERARTWLHEKLDVDEAKMKVESAVAATWPDAALGCPQKGHMYAQVVTEGWAVTIEADGKTHEVHVSGRRAVSCEPKPGSQKK